MLIKKVFIILLAGFVVTSCHKEDLSPADHHIVDYSTVDETQLNNAAQLKGVSGLKGTAGLNGAATQCKTSIIDAASGNPVTGTAGLLRTDNKISMTCKINDLTPGNAYTIWWVIWNKPEECTTPYACDVIDYDIAETVEVDALYAAGHVVGNSGIGNFSGSLNENDISGSINDLFGLPAYGLQDARTAEVHLVLRNHGPTIPGEVNEQISTYSGGCTTNECTDPLFAVFSPHCEL